MYLIYNCFFLSIIHSVCYMHINIFANTIFLSKLNLKSKSQFEKNEKIIKYPIKKRMCIVNKINQNYDTTSIVQKNCSFKLSV